MSTSSTIQNYYYAICDQVAFLLKNISANFMMYFELVGSVRCAAALLRMGREKEAKTLLIAARKLREVGRLKA
jgi:hypothetical protein